MKPSSSSYQAGACRTLSGNAVSTGICACNYVFTTVLLLVNIMKSLNCFLTLLKAAKNSARELIIQNSFIETPNYT